jgi:hypothetical protein
MAMTLAAVCVQGVHPYVEDAEIYVPGIKKLLNPGLYPSNSEFFMSHAGMTLFPNFVAASIRIVHISTEWALFLWQIVTIFLLLWACWRIGKATFPAAQSAWAGTALVAALLSIPVAGTALYIMDQYITTRAFSTAATLWVVAEAIERNWIRAGLWLLFTALIHPLMVLFCVSYAALFYLVEHDWSPFRSSTAAAAVFTLLPTRLFPPVTDAYREVLDTRSYFSLLRWQWYEWLGIFGPLLLMEWFRRIARRHNLAVLERICRTTILFGILWFAAALVVSVPPSLAQFAKLQPLRALQLEFILLFLCAGGLLGQFVLQRVLWRWLVLFVPICAGMFYAQRQLFPATSHIEWPGAPSPNPWVQAFVWVRFNTPRNAMFALDPRFMLAPQEDQQGFRALAERSRIADRVKDSGAVTMFPQLAERWRAQVRALDGWEHFTAADFARLKQRFGVDWVVLERPAGEGMQCPYENERLRVCHLP